MHNYIREEEEIKRKTIINHFVFKLVSFFLLMLNQSLLFDFNNSSSISNFI